MISLLLAGVLLMACKGYLFTCQLPSHSATIANWCDNVGKIYKIAALQSSFYTASGKAA